MAGFALVGIPGASLKMRAEEVKAFDIDDIGDDGKLIVDEVEEAPKPKIQRRPAMAKAKA